LGLGDLGGVIGQEKKSESNQRQEKMEGARQLPQGCGGVRGKTPKGKIKTKREGHPAAPLINVSQKQGVFHVIRTHTPKTKTGGGKRKEKRLKKSGSRVGDDPRNSKLGKFFPFQPNTRKKRRGGDKGKRVRRWPVSNTLGRNHGPHYNQAQQQNKREGGKREKKGRMKRNKTLLRNHEARIGRAKGSSTQKK